jgi:large subunit ribosomal protein L29
MAQEKENFKEMANDALQARLASMETEILQMKFDHAVKGLANPMELRQVRREIARAQTELRQRELAAMTPEELELRSKIRARRRRNN